MKICDLTQFYSPFSGGVKRYVHEKIAYVQSARPCDEHVLIVPGARDEIAHAERSRIYTIGSPLVSRSTRYRALLDLRAIDRILEREQPNLIESADPYQIGWKAVSAARVFGLPAVAFYHSHFPEAHLRGFGQGVMKLAQQYVRRLYNGFDATLVPSDGLASVLENWGVRNVRRVSLGVNTEIFRPEPDDRAATRQSLGIPDERMVLLYVGRLAPEKNTAVLFAAFEELAREWPQRFQLLLIGDGVERAQVRRLQRLTSCVTWLQYCADSTQLARYYRAADLFAHPGVQETFGLVALESQACGTPVVGIRGSYMDRAIFHDQELWACENSSAALAAAILAMSEQDLDAMGRSAACEAERMHSWTRVFERLFCIYGEVCSHLPRAR